MLCLCGRQVLQVGQPPITLDAEPHPLGVWTTDGRRLSLREVASAGSNHRAHRKHECAARLDDHPGLFGVVE
jgi:hypothetical protein